ncbi:hypothetical protein [Marispirochaeta sp.]|uniref:hypothetical protein n=1 Tax=Marispirochaeta sp. TaxID=2038653 RepID=UPI0029C97826|nr:hypothetical protein [Marispirochaeta sp.]
MRKWYFFWAFLYLFLLFPLGNLYAADLTVSTMELITTGSVDDDTFVLDTFGEIDIDIQGGYKLGGAVSLGIESDNIGPPRKTLENGDTDQDIITYLNSTSYIFLKSARVTVRDAFYSPINVSYFTGEIDTFGDGDIFPKYFGTNRVASLFRGRFYFPESVVYDGLYAVNGTGIQVETDFGRPWNLFSVYSYQDNYLGPGHFTSDLRWTVDKEYVKLDAFAGSSFPYGEYGLYHGGILVGLTASEKGEFFAQVGVPRLSPGDNDMDIGLFYFLFEPRIHFNRGSLIFTFFSHPSYYKEYVLSGTSETGEMHTNINLQFGKPEISPFAGGIEGTIHYNDDSDIDGVISPYLSFITSGAVWNLKFSWVATELNDVSQMFYAFVGVRAEF